MAVSVKAPALQPGDVFEYGSWQVTVLGKPTKVNACAGGDLFEVHGEDNGGQVRWMDYSQSETVQVVSGPSTAVPVKAPAKPVTTATQRAREYIRGGKVRSLPASAALVLYALAAAQDESSDGVPSEGSIATGAGLAISTTKGHLSSLKGKGLVIQHGNYGWAVA